MCVQKVPVDPCIDPPGFFVLGIMKIIVDLPGLGFLVPQDVHSLGSSTRTFAAGTRRHIPCVHQTSHVRHLTSAILGLPR